MTAVRYDERLARRRWHQVTRKNPEYSRLANYTFDLEGLPTREQVIVIFRSSARATTYFCFETYGWSGCAPTERPVLCCVGS